MVWGDWKSGVFPHSHPMGSVVSKGLVKAGCESLMSFAGALVGARLGSLAEMWGCWPREGRNHLMGQRDCIGKGKAWWDKEIP